MGIRGPKLDLKVLNRNRCIWRMRFMLDALGYWRQGGLYQEVARRCGVSYATVLEVMNTRKPEGCYATTD